MTRAAIGLDRERGQEIGSAYFHLSEPAKNTREIDVDEPETSAINQEAGLGGFPCLQGIF